jgi:integrase
MPYKRKDSPVWWVSIATPNGKRLRRTTGTENRKEAEALEAKWKLEAYRAAHWDEQPAHSFDELMLAYLKARADKRSAKDDRQRCKVLRRMFGGRDMHTLTVKDRRAYIDMRRQERVTDSTINRELALIRAAINYAAREWGWELPNPFRGMLREPEGKLRWITREEAARLLWEAGRSRCPHLADFIRLALHTGMRSGEMLYLEWDRVDLQRRVIYLEAAHTKAKKRRAIPLNQDAREALLSRARFRATHCPGSPWVFAEASGLRVRSMRAGVETACRRAGIETFRIHDLRHTFASWLVQAGVPLYSVKDLLGHAAIKMTERYAHLSHENTRCAVEVLESRSRSGHATGMEELKEVG